MKQARTIHCVMCGTRFESAKYNILTCSMECANKRKSEMKNRPEMKHHDDRHNAKLRAARKEIRDALPLKPCHWCKQDFKPKRRDNKFCSLKCQKACTRANMSQYYKYTHVPLERNCAICQKQFIRSGSQKYCSDECRAESHRRGEIEARNIARLKLIHKCSVCGKNFQARQHNQHICSRECNRVHDARRQRINTELAAPVLTRICKHCGNSFQTQNNRKVYCTKICKRGKQGKVQNTKRALTRPARTILPRTITPKPHRERRVVETVTFKPKPEPIIYTTAKCAVCERLVDRVSMTCGCCSQECIAAAPSMIRAKSLLDEVKLGCRVYVTHYGRIIIGGVERVSRMTDAGFVRDITGDTATIEYVGNVVTMPVSAIGVTQNSIDKVKARFMTDFGNPAKLQERPIETKCCKICGCEFPVKSKLQLCCSKECSTKAKSINRKAREAAKRVESAI